MNKFVVSISAALLITGLAGCGANNDISRANEHPPTYVGYSMNDANSNRQGAFSQINDRGFNDQGMFDQVDALHVGHEMGDEIEDGIGDGGAYSQRDGFGHGNYNFHGQMHTSYAGQPTDSYNDGHEYVIAQRITDRLEHLNHVEDVAAIINRDTVLVALDTNGNNDPKLIKKAHRIAQGIATNQKVRITTDERFFTKVRNIQNAEDRETAYNELFQEFEQ